MSTVSIKKAKIKDDLFLEVEYSEKVTDGTNSVKKSCTAPVHSDLRKAFYNLSSHLGLLCAQTIENKNKPKVSVSISSEAQGEEIELEDGFKFDTVNLEIAKTIMCTGFSIGGSGDNEGISLIGRRVLSGERILNLVSPFQQWDDHDYPYVEELAEQIEICRQEVHLYLFEGKHQPDNQLSLFDQSANEDEDNDELLK